MKTIIIWDMCGLGPLSFFVVDGDKSHLDGLYINNSEQDMKLHDELMDLIYSKEGLYVHKKYSKFPRKTAMNTENKIIVCGFLP